MATNIITELDQQLASLNQLKPPGASKSKIQSITTLCVNNIQVSTATRHEWRREFLWRLSDCSDAGTKTADAD